MKILDAQFVQGVVDETAVLYDGTPQIAFIGRSNVGKSSTLNALAGKRKLVKVGQTPGKTKEINFFDVSFREGEDAKGHVYFVDLPGYGYAKLSKQRRDELQQLIHWYLSHPEADIALVCIVIDAKVGITEHDRAILETLREHKRSFVVAVNKVDKLNQKSRHTLTQSLEEELQGAPYVLYSATDGKHVNKLNELIFKGS